MNPDPQAEASALYEKFSDENQRLTDKIVDDFSNLFAQSEVDLAALRQADPEEPRAADRIWQGVVLAIADTEEIRKKGRRNGLPGYEYRPDPDDAPLHTYTVIGYRETSAQRFADTVRASDPGNAESVARVQYGLDLAICAVLEGDVTPVDTDEYVNNGD